jgi:regulator of RNase E activity RraA
MPRHLQFIRITTTYFRTHSIARYTRTMSSSSHVSPEALKILRRYGACDISDALLKLKVPGAGFLPDLIPYRGQISEDTGKLQPILVAPVSTVLFIPKNDDGSAYPPSNIPAGEHWVDLTQAGTIAVLSQPEGQRNAVLGGIMVLRMKKLSALGVVVHGRIRDIQELKDTELMVRQCCFLSEGYSLTSFFCVRFGPKEPPQSEPVLKASHMLSIFQSRSQASLSHPAMSSSATLQMVLSSFHSQNLMKFSNSYLASLGPMIK